MRLCQSCNCPDRPQIKGDVPCTCNTNGIFAEAHDYFCDALSHWVTPYYVPLEIRGSGPQDRERKAKELFQAKYEAKGYKLQTSNGKYFATIYWCVDCIGKHEISLMIWRDYDKHAKKATRVNETWAQMLCMD